VIRIGDTFQIWSVKVLYVIIFELVLFVIPGLLFVFVVIGVAKEFFAIMNMIMEKEHLFRWYTG